MKKLATIGLMADSGCHIALLDLHGDILKILEKVQLVHSYILTDSKEIPESVDITLVEGGVRTQHDEEIVKKARKKSKIIVALGSCACFGGIPSLCNVHGTKDAFNYVYAKTMSTDKNSKLPVEIVPQLKNSVAPISNYIKIEAGIPGCPPPVKEINAALTALIQDEEWKLPQISVCDECELKRSFCRAYTFWNTFLKQPAKPRRNYEAPDPDLCLAEQGYICLGAATRGGCEARCTNIGIPCDGCRGNLTPDLQSSPSRESLASLAMRNAKASGLIAQHINSFYRFNLGIIKPSQVRRK